MPKHAFLENDGVLAFAHRGDQDAGPENTLAAFEGAVQQGFGYLETDVHCTRDGQVLAFHDDRLDRVTDQRGVIAQMDYAAVQAARVGGREPIPRLDDLLEAFPEVRFNIDPKSDTVVEPLVALLRSANAQARVCIGSFSGRRLSRVRTMLPGVCTSMGPLETTRARVGSLGLPVGRFKAVCAQVPVWWNGIKVIDARFIRSMNRQGLQTHVWTVNEPAEMNRLLDLGVDGLMTDRPRLLKAVLIERGQWPQAV